MQPQDARLILQPRNAHQGCALLQQIIKQLHHASVRGLLECNEGDVNDRAAAPGDLNAHARHARQSIQQEALHIFQKISCVEVALEVRNELRASLKLYLLTQLALQFSHAVS